MDIVKQYEELLKLDPGSIAFSPLAEELCYRGFWEGAVKVCRQGLTHHPQHLRGQVLLGWALKELGESEEAEKVLVAVEGEIQKNALLFRLLAELAKKAGDPERTERLMLIHQNLQSSAIDRATPAETKAEVEPPPEGPKEEIADFLDSLLSRYDAIPEKTAAEQQLFTEDDRQTLSRILKSLKH
jgi:predicted Zn-dependent protease